MKPLIKKQSPLSKWILAGEPQVTRAWCPSQAHIGWACVHIWPLSCVDTVLTLHPALGILDQVTEYKWGGDSMPTGDKEGVHTRDGWFLSNRGLQAFSGVGEIRWDLSEQDK